MKSAFLELSYCFQMFIHARYFNLIKRKTHIVFNVEIEEYHNCRIISIREGKAPRSCNLSTFILVFIHKGLSKENNHSYRNIMIKTFKPNEDWC